ncbi:MFS transporter [Paenibacillus sp. T1]|uniref:MFS transporter n=1 Tax=Paenibacillus glycinis TaxID=2697035 RepID=A0ABW9XZT6_9BACL|nr:MFS transporter [Paenibacillus glycinis]
MNPSKTIILTIIIACQLMVILDASVMVTALPEIGRTLHMTTTQLTWVQNAYTLAFGGLLLLGARAGDILGRRRMFSVGIAIFTLASIMVGVAQSSEFLLLSRALQGLAAAIATPSTLALLSVSFVEAKERSKAIALYSAVAGAGGSVGLILGGLLTDFISWRVGMFINVPIGIALLLMVPRYLPETNKNQGQFDVMGALTSVIGMTSLVFGFVQAASSGWDAPVTLISLALGAAMLVAFVLIEARAKQPITPLRLFGNRQRSGAYLGRFLFVGGNFAIFFFVPQFLQNVLGFSSLEAGIAFLPFTTVMFGMMYAMPWLFARFGQLKVLLAGIAIAIIGTALLSRISVDAHYYPQMFFPLIVMGIGAGMVFSPFTTFGLAGVEPRDAGAASGLVNVAHQTGGSLGLAILITVFDAANRSGGTSKADFAHSASVSLTGSAIFLTAALVVVLVWFRPARQKVRRPGLEPDRDAA